MKPTVQSQSVLARLSRLDKSASTLLYNLDHRPLTALMFPFSYPFGSPVVCCGLLPAIGLAAASDVPPLYLALAVLPSLLVWLAMSAVLYTGSRLDEYTPYKADIAAYFALYQALVARAFLDSRLLAYVLGFIVCWIVTAFPIVFMIKQWTFRPRPLTTHGFAVASKRMGVFTLEGRSGNTRASFPSGDAAGGAVTLAYWLLAHLTLSGQSLTSWQLGLLVLSAIALGSGRVYFGVHYLSDIVAGSLLGISVAFLAHAVLDAIGPWLTADAGRSFFPLVVLCLLASPLDGLRKRMKRSEA
jgi:membrane-associated phospholipid phosphatase